ncbi:MAG: hypothetical protein V1889_00875 [archaeon]
MVKFSRALKSVKVGYYRPKENSHPENRILVSTEHYLYVKGPVRDHVEEIRDSLLAAVIKKQFGDWKCFEHRRRISLEQLSFYEKVGERDLPWDYKKIVFL